MSKILDFYFLGGKNSNGLTLEDIWQFNFFELEHNHSYIQFLFPIVEPSYFHRDFPILLTSDIREFRKIKELKKKLVNSFFVMLNFYGLKISLKDDKIVVEKGDNYEERKNKWQTGRNHNFLRITRILLSLKFLGLEKVSKAFFDCLIKLVEENPSGFNQISIDYWKDAVKEIQ